MCLERTELRRSTFDCSKSKRESTLKVDEDVKPMERDVEVKRTVGCVSGGVGGG